jgi:hypothetical protein
MGCAESEVPAEHPCKGDFQVVGGVSLQLQSQWIPLQLLFTRLKYLKLMRAPAVGLFQSSFSFTFWKCWKEYMVVKLLLLLLLDFFLIVPELKADKFMYV